jgi:hypothetical protein
MEEPWHSLPGVTVNDDACLAVWVRISNESRLELLTGATGDLAFHPSPALVEDLRAAGVRDGRDGPVPPTFRTWLRGIARVSS